MHESSAVFICFPSIFGGEQVPALRFYGKKRHRQVRVEKKKKRQPPLFNKYIKLEKSTFFRHNTDDFFIRFLHPFLRQTRNAGNRAFYALFDDPIPCVKLIALFEHF